MSSKCDITLELYRTYICVDCIGTAVKIVNINNHIICDRVCENRSYLHIQFYDFEDTQLTLWVSYRYTNLSQVGPNIGL